MAAGDMGKEEVVVFGEEGAEKVIAAVGEEVAAAEMGKEEVAEGTEKVVASAEGVTEEVDEPDKEDDSYLLIK